jgi:hypothetical protein
MLYSAQEFRSVALQLQTIVYEARKQLLGPEYPDSLNSELRIDKISNSEQPPMPMVERFRSLIPV